jgi:hypothetical protein
MHAALSSRPDVAPSFPAAVKHRTRGQVPLGFRGGFDPVREMREERQEP